MGATAKLRIGLAEDNDLFRELLSGALSQVEDFDVVIAAPSVTEFRDQFAETPVDVALLDIALPDGNGVGLARSLRVDNPDLAVVLLSAQDVLDLLSKGSPMERKGWSYLSKSSTTNLQILVNTIRATAQGSCVIDPLLLEKKLALDISPYGALTKKQKEVLEGVARGLSNKQIAEEMDLSVASIETHLTGIYQTLELPEHANNRVAAVLKYLELHPSAQ